MIKKYIYICLLFCGETTETYEMLKETLGMIVIKHYNKNWSISNFFFKVFIFCPHFRIENTLVENFCVVFRLRISKANSCSLMSCGNHTRKSKKIDKL